MIMFDVLLDDIGKLGLSQILLILLYSYFNISGGMNALATVFIGYTPDYRCNVPPIDNSSVFPNLTENEILTLTSPNNTCKRYIYDVTSCTEQNLTNCIDTSQTESCLDGYKYDTSLFTLTATTEFNLVCENDYLNSLSTSVYYVGLLIGSFVFGNFCDTYGRKTTNIICFIGVLATSLAWTFSYNITEYIVFRTLAAAVGYGCNLATYVYICEVVGEEWRATAGIFSGCWFAFGYMLQSVIGYYYRDWHQFMLVCTLVSSPFLLFAIIIPESPRWLFIKGKDKQAKKVVSLMTRLNKTEVKESTWIRANTENLEKKKEAVKDEDKTVKYYTSFDLFKLPRTRLITLNMCFTWLVANIVYYGLGLNAAALPGDIFTNNALNGVMDVLAHIFCILAVNRIGRKLLLVLTFEIAGVAMMCSTLTTELAYGNEGLIMFGKVCAFIGKFGISAAFSTCYLMAAELYPTPTRTIAMGTASTVSRLGSIGTPYIIMLQNYISWLPNSIFAVLGVVAGGLALFYPETKGVDLLETIEDAEIFYKTGKAPGRGQENLALEKDEEVTKI